MRQLVLLGLRFGESRTFELSGRESLAGRVPRVEEPGEPAGETVPKASKVTEKNNGCNHIVCQIECGHEFCLVCLEPRTTHSKETGDATGTISLASGKWRRGRL